MTDIEMIDCPDCKGTGKFEWQDEMEDCATCDGEGEISEFELRERRAEEDGERMMEDERGN